MLNLAELSTKLTPIETERLRDLGDILQYALPWLALLAVALEGNQLESWRCLYIGFSNTVLTQLFKYLFDFTPYGLRPDGGNGAFPSGHTSSAFMGAGFIYFEFGLVAAIVPFGLAALTAYSRVVAKRHWVRDVIFGALLALVVNYWFFFEVGVRVPEMG